MKEQIVKLRKQGKSYNEIVAILGCSKSQVAYHSNAEYKTLQDQRTIERRRRIKEEAVEYKGGKCQVCDYNKCITALDFHHLDPELKDVDFKCGFNLEKLKPELDKCILLCCRCHREVHAGLLTL